MSSHSDIIVATYNNDKSLLLIRVHVRRNRRVVQVGATQGGTRLINNIRYEHFIWTHDRKGGYLSISVGYIPESLVFSVAKSCLCCCGSPTWYSMTWLEAAHILVNGNNQFVHWSRTSGASRVLGDDYRPSYSMHEKRKENTIGADDHGKRLTSANSTHYTYKW